MNNRFEIGEVVLVYRRGVFNREGTIVDAGYLPYRGLLGECSDFGYYVDNCEGPYGVSFCRPQNLRKKKPPREDLEVTRWVDCPWQPNKIKESV